MNSLWDIRIFLGLVQKESPCSKNQLDVLISQICFGIELYMFRTGLLSIIRSLVLYTQQ
jgi:hypothetical protein